MKNRIKLTESQLHRVIKESVKKVLKEGIGNDRHYDIAKNVKCDDKSYTEFYNDLMNLVDGIGVLNWSLKNNNRLDNNLKQSIRTVLNNKETIKDAILNQYREFLDSCRSWPRNDLNQNITDEIRIQDRYEPPYNDNDYEPEDWYERNEHGDFDSEY